MAFDTAAVNALVDGVASIAAKTGTFRSVNTHEPKAAPGSGLRCAIWADSIQPIALASGLASTSGYVTMLSRVYGNMLSKPEDDIDPRLMASATTLLGAYTADFTLGGLVRNLDLLGAYGTKMGAQAGYVTIGGSMFRIMTVTLPCVVDDLWAQVS
jgi:hypothetical protein